MNLVVTRDGIGNLTDDGIDMLDLPQTSLEDLVADPGWRERLKAARVVGREATRAIVVPLRPRAFWLVGSNYPGRSSDLPERPAFYLRSTSSLSGPGDTVAMPAGLEVHPDAEVAVVIGTRTHRIHEDNAWEALAGITACNDVTARNLLDGGRGVAIAKSSPGFGALGGSLRLTNGPIDVDIELDVDGESRQRGGSGEMFFSIAELVARLSYLTVLEPGDVIATGSPSSSSTSRLEHGQTATVRVSGVHPLTTQFIHEEKS